MRFRGPLHLIVAGFCACASPGDSASPTVTDSLGVTLVDYSMPFETSSDKVWSVGPEPMFSLDATDAQWYQVRTALFQSTGNIVVANGGNHEILLFDRTGQPRTQTGGEGGGPGEFQLLTVLSVGAGDSLHVYDGRQRRLSVFDPDGNFVRSVSLQVPDSFWAAENVGVLHSGEIVGGFARRTRGDGLVRDSMVVMKFSSSGTLDATLGVFPHFYTHWGPHAVPGGGAAVSFPLPVALSAVTAVGFGVQTVFVAIPDPYRLIQLGPDGSQRVTRQRAPMDPLEEEQRVRFFAAFGGTSGARNMDEREMDMLRDLRGPGTLPAFGAEPLTARIGEQTVVVTDVGGVWLRPFQFPGDSATAAWPRFDADGLFEGFVRMPGRFRVTAVREGLVLGVYVDALDVEHVRVYRMVEP